MHSKIRKNKKMHDNLYLEVVTGPYQGRMVRIQEGLRVGRSRGEFQINDPKISSLHAQVIKHRKGFFILRDKQSRNKIIFNGERVDQLALMPGIQFMLGDTKFRVLQETTKETDAEETTIVAGTNSDTQQIKEESFLIDLDEFLKQERNIVLPVTIHFFETPLWLVFTHGAEMGRQIGLIYGPRIIGRESHDIQISEPSSPPTAFSIKPIPNHPRAFDFHTQYPALVRLNNNSVQNMRVETPSTIQIGKTQISIFFSEEQ